MKREKVYAPRRLAALTLALLMALVQVVALAAQPQTTVSVSLNYTKADGTPMSLTAAPVAYPGYENAFWLYVDQDAQNDPNASLAFADVSGVTQRTFSIPNGTLASDYYMYNAEGNLQTQPVEFYSLDELSNPVDTYRLYFSLSKEQPDPPVTEVQPAQIVIYYNDASGQQITSETRMLNPGANTVTPDSSLLPPGYTLTGTGEYLVTVTEAGADYAQITFTYEAPPVETPVPAQPVEITVTYVDVNNQFLNSEQVTVHPGSNTVTPNPALVPQGYTPVGTQEYTVNMNESGADTLEVVFMYEAPPVETPAPVQPVEITVTYVDANNQFLNSEQVTVQPGSNTVTPNPALVPQGYTPIGTQEYTVNVNESGADALEVVFMYEAPPVETPVPAQPVDITVTYVDANNQFLNSEQVTVQPGSNTVTPNPALIPQGYTPVGAQEYTVNVNETGADITEVIFMFEAPLPTEAPTEEPVPAVTIDILYQDQATGREVATAQQLLLQAGTTTVSPNPTDLEPGYVQAGQSVYNVTVDRAGASMNPVIFVYTLETPVSTPVTVVVSYVDEAGNKVASDTVLTLSEGKNPVTAAPADLQDGYALLPTEDMTKYVTVTQNTATPPSLSFVYGVITVVSPTPPPAPKAPLVNVVYKNEAGDVLYSTTAPCKEGENNVIAVDLNQVNLQVYELISPPEVIVTVDSAGTPSQSEVVFLFKDITVKSDTITVHYRDESGAEVAPSQTYEIKTGTWQVQAKPDNLPAGYALVSDSVVEVSLSPSGVLSQKDVVFVYAKPATPTPEPTASPEPTVLPFDITSLDQYAYPIKDGINFRSSPDAALKDNILGQVNATDLAHVMGSLKNKQGEDWLLVDINGQEGFLKSTMARILSFEETAALFNWTPTPAPVATPTPDPLTDGEIIDRWASVNSTGGVNLRAKASTSSTRIAALENGERFWVYTQQTVNGTVWYSVMANGKTGFVAAEFARLYTPEESAQYQATLATPMPYQITPTPQVTASPTPAVTAAPATKAPVATAAPTVYHGPALTIMQTPLRTGMSQVDEPIQEYLPVDSLVQVWNQTWIGSEGWSQVQVMADKQVGYVPNSSLRYINEQEANYYLAQLTPQATPSPVPVTQPQVQQAGFAISRGENVPLRAYTDTNAKIEALLAEGQIVSVIGQEYVAGTTWHVVQSGSSLGYVREDQLRLLSAAESQNYLNSLRTPIPAPVATLPPVTANSPTSYGYVTTDLVRLRSEPNTSSREIKLLSKNAFALVLGSSVQSDGIWYNISQNGTTGYIRGDFFSVLPMNQLSTYLQSPEYLNANTQTSPNQGYTGSSQITPLESFNTSVWQNPNLANVSYEPFNPLGSPTPPVEAIFTPTPTPELSPSPTLLTVEGFEQPPEKPDSGINTGLVVVGILALLGGGGYYAYHLYNQNQKRAAQRAAERRAQAARQAGQPQTRPAQPNPYSPPGQGQTPTQGTTQYRPQTPPGQGQPPAQGTTQYRPQTPPGQGQPPTQGTAQYRPMTPPTQGQTPTQGTTQYRPQTPPGQGQTPTQGTTPYRPMTPPAQGQPPQTPAQGTRGSQTPNEDGAEQRRRRSDRHSNT